MDGIASWMGTPTIIKSLLLQKVKKKTTSTFPYGNFTFKRMSFGLCYALATF